MASDTPSPGRPARTGRGQRPPRGQGPASPFGRILAQIGGMRSDLVDDYPTERRDFVQMAFILFTTGLMASISAAFAINMAFTTPTFDRQHNLTGFESPPFWVLVVSGLVWGLIIFNIDRYMVLGMEGLHRWSTLGPAIIRGGLAVLIGLVLSTPLVLQIFSSEIDNEIVDIHIESTKNTEAKLVSLQNDFNEAQAKVDAQEVVVAEAGEQPNLEQNQSYKDAVAAYKEAVKECSVARNRQTLERRGKLSKKEGGSGEVGVGEIYYDLKDVADQICGTKPDKLKRMNDIEKASTRSPEEIAAKVKREQATLDQLVAQKDSREKVLNANRSKLGEKTGSWGLLIRLEALERIVSPAAVTVVTTPEISDPSTIPSPDQTTSAAPDDNGSAPVSTETVTTADENRMASIAHLALIGLLASIEILPILFKTIKQWNPHPTAYECHWRDLDNAVLARTRLQQQRALAALNQTTYAEVIDEALSREQREQVGREMVQDVTGVQLQFMRNELQRWADEHGVEYQPGTYGRPAASGNSSERGRRRRGPATESSARETPTAETNATPQTPTAETNAAQQTDPVEPDSSGGWV